MKVMLIVLLMLVSVAVLGDIYNVPDWVNGIYSIQDGIDLSADGDTVLVSHGTYYENINFLGKKITVASEFLISGEEEDIDDTIIDGGGIDTVVRMESGEDTLSFLCGFVIRNGYFGRGGGIHIFRSGAKLEYLKIRDNVAESQNYPFGAGIYANGDIFNMIHPTWQDIIIRNTEISNNTVIGNHPSGGGIYLCRGINLLLMDNVTITENHCEGGTSSTGGGGTLVLFIVSL